MILATMTNLAPTPLRPPGMPLMRMQWRSLLFMHWPVPVEVLRPLVPEALTIDTFDGVAWIGLIPFTMRDVSPVVLPRVPLPGLTDFHECNVRTYVTHDGPRGGSGVYFFSLDAASRAAVWGARKFFHLPYFYARMSLQREGDVIRYAVDRQDHRSGPAHLRCVWRAKDELPTSQPGEFAHFATERYSLFTMDRKNHVRRCRIWHEPWKLRAAELLELDDTLIASAGINVPDHMPVLHHSDVLNMRAWKLEKSVSSRPC